MNSKLLFTGVLLCFALNSFSQSSTKYGLPKPKDYDRFGIGLYGGVCLFQGDVREKSEPQNGYKNFTSQPAFGLQFNYQMSHSIGLLFRGGYAKFRQAPDDTFYVGSLNKPMLLEYESPVYEGSANMVFSFGNISFLDRNARLHFVASVGVGLMSHEGTIKNQATGEEVKTEDQATEVILPFGFGVKFKTGPVDLGLTFDYNKMFTDEVDMIDQGSSYDGYSHVLLSVNYTFGKKEKPMEWVNPMQMVYNDVADVKQKVDNLGGDKDKDGVADLFDRDNNTPEGIKVYGDGTSVDTDKDGVPDYKDGDPYSMPGAKVDASGKEIDSDNDGVGDSEDKEPNTVAGSLVNFQGVSITKAGKSGGDGMLVSKEVINNNGGLGFLPSVFFDLGKSSIKTVYYERLLMIARVMKLNPDVKFNIIGSTDQKGKNDSNKKLGRARAENVKDHLVKIYGIDPARLNPTTIGMDEPLAKPTKTTDYLNRRVDFRVVME